MRRLVPVVLDLHGTAGCECLVPVWTLAMTVAVAAMLLRRRGMRRPEAVLVIAS